MLFFQKEKMALWNRQSAIFNAEIVSYSIMLMLEQARPP
jgi:hypothetical protein